MWNKLKIKWPYKVLVGCLAVFLLIGLVEKKHSETHIQQVIININQAYDQYFIDRAEINKLISNDNVDNLMNVSMDEIDLKKIEERLKTNKYVKRADVYKDLKGGLIVNIDQRTPIARVLHASGPDAYISGDGVILPVSEKHTARVMLISGVGTEYLVKEDITEESKYYALCKMINFIDKDEFWKAQVAQIDLTKTGELIIYPQVGKQIIEFGTPDDYETKFKKLKLFFTKILPYKGWNTYTKVNIKYNNQIVCE